MEAKKFFRLTCIALLIFSLQAIAEEQSERDDASNNSSLERIEEKLDHLVEQRLGDRNVGIEFNFFRVLAWEDEDKSLSGTFSRFNTRDNTEFAFPLMYSQGDQGQTNGDVALKSITLDAHFRKYPGHRLNGFYISAFTRLAHLRGFRESGSRGSESKFGLGIGIGYRIISSNGLYWGASLSLGRFLSGKSDAFIDSKSASADLDDEEWIIDIELLKFGYAF